MKDFFELKLGSMIVDEYERRFLELLKYVTFINDEQVKIHRYLTGLPSFISDKIQYDDPETLEEAIRHTKCHYDQHRGIQTFQKAWEDKMKSKVEQRKTETEPPFFINTAQGQPTPKEPKMTETMKKIPRQQPIQCWGCCVDHMCKDYPQIAEKERIVHNVQQTMVVEDMGRNLPRIYIVLDNKKVDFQSHMI
jgi:hypothetical protein